jgi:HAE1 family hydrophobic/amphiphilic exporter-1
MFLSDLSIRRPVFATVLMLALVTLGLFSYRRLAIDQFPNVEIPVVNIITRFPGASPETVEREVTKKIEEAVNPIAGVKHVFSFSKEGVSSVVVEFNLEVKVNEASQDCRTKIAAVRGSLPQGMEEPVIQKLDFASMPVISLAVRGRGLTPRELSTYVDRRIKPRLESIAGVGKVDLVGLTRREVEVRIDPSRLEGLKMGVDEVINGLRAENVNTPLGRMTREGQETVLRVAGKPGQVEGFREMVISRRGNLPVTLGEVAEIRDSVEERRSLAVIDGEPAIGVDILKQSGANTVETVDAVKRAAGILGKELPPGVELRIVRDGSTWIRESVADVEETLVIGALLTIFIVFLFLNSWRSTVITGLTLPIAVISAFIVMNFMHMTLNIMTLMALSLAIGMLIDDAIVVRENIVRHLEMGKDHFAASRQGTSEIGLAVLATTFSVVAVFVPVAYMKGIIGRFFFEFGLTVAFAVLVSLFVSFTLDPMLSSRWYDPAIHRTGARGPVTRLLDRFNAFFDRMAESYRGAISFALAHRFLVMVLAVVAFVGGIALFGRLEQSFIQSYDRAEFQISFKAAPDASLAETEGRLRAMVERLRGIPEVARTYATIGSGEAGTVREGAIYVALTPKGERARSQAEVEREVRARLREVAGVVFGLQEAGRLGNEKPLTVAIKGEEIALLKKYSEALLEALHRTPGIVDLESSLAEEVPEYRLVVDRARAVDAGVNTDAVVRTVGALVGGTVVSTYEDETGEAVDVRVRLPEGLRREPSQVAALRLTARRADGSAALIPLGEVTSYDSGTTPAQIDRRDLQRQVSINAGLDGIPIGTAVERVREAAARIPMEPGYSLVFVGEAERMAESFGYLMEALLMAIIFVYLILSAQFESFVTPLSIMLSLPLSVVGMAGALWLTGDTISIMSLIGLIMLMGLVTKNAILLVDYAITLRGQGLERREAVIRSGRTRLRPIMMTTLAMIFGMLPLATGLGAGGEMRAPLARAVIGGLITSTVLTLVVVPVVYTLLDDVSARLRRFWNTREEVTHETAN